MGKLTTAAAPDFTDDEQKWLERHPGMRMTLFIVRLALVPIALAIISGYYSARVEKTDKKTTAGYQVTREAMEDLQKQVKTLSENVDVMRQLFVLSMRNGGTSASAGVFSGGTTRVEVDTGSHRPARPPRFERGSYEFQDDPLSGTIGLGTTGTLGHGAGTGSGQGLGAKPSLPEVKKAVDRLKAEASKPLQTSQKAIPRSLDEAVQQTTKY